MRRIPLVGNTIRGGTFEHERRLTMAVPMDSSARIESDILESRFSNAKVTKITDMKYVGETEWRFSTNDPCVVFELEQKTFKNNTCLLAFDARPTRPGAVGKLYVDYGIGFLETAAANIDYSRTDSALAILTDVDRIRSLRWDPDDQEGAGIRIESLRILETDAAADDFVQDYIAQVRATEKNRTIFSTLLSKVNAVLPRKIKQKQAETFARLNVAARRRPSTGGTSLLLSPGRSANGTLGETLIEAWSSDRRG